MYDLFVIFKYEYIPEERTVCRSISVLIVILKKIF